jgi:hypothetical protein
MQVLRKQHERIEGERPLQESSAEHAPQQMSTATLGEQPCAAIRHEREEE